jgi:hypothetical protein
MNYFIHLPLKMELIEVFETSAFRTQTPGNYPKENTTHIEHGESSKSRNPNSFDKYSRNSPVDDRSSPHHKK